MTVAAPDGRGSTGRGAARAGARSRAAAVRCTYAPVGRTDLPLDLRPPATRVPAEGRRIVVLTDAQPEHTRLRALIDRFVASFDGSVEIVNLYEVGIRGGCQGCLRCGPEFRRVYTGKGGFVDFYNDAVRGADIVVFAGTIVDRQMS